VRSVPVEFLTDEAAAYGRYAGMPSPADLDRVFFLDDDDLKLVGKHRGEHMRAGFALQLVTVRWLGTFLEDPLDIPGGVLDFVAGQQLGMTDPSRVKRYTEREHTRFDHQWEIKKDRGYREFCDADVAQDPDQCGQHATPLVAEDGVKHHGSVRRGWAAPRSRCRAWSGGAVPGRSRVPRRGSAAGLSGHGDFAPQATVQVEVVAIGLPRAAVGDIGVQRMPAVGGLRRASGYAAQADQRGYRAIEIVRQSTIRQPVLDVLPGKTLKMISATR
jgi:hypothetical protein